MRVMSLTAMGKKRAQPDKGSTPQFYATVGYKLWVRRRLADKETGMTYKELVAAIKRVDRTASATTSSLSQFLGRNDEMPTPSNTSLMPAMNKVLGIAPPPLCDPDNPMAQLADRFAANWPKLSPRERDLLRAILGDHDDES